MSSYPEIDPKDIKAGDTIERHWIGTVMTMPVARVEGRLAYSPGDYCIGLHAADGEKFFLVDRPAPPIGLSETPTLGRLTWDTGNEGGSEVAEWMVHRDGVFGGSARVPVAGVTEFVPGSFVPTSALDELREASRRATYVQSAHGRAVNHHRAIVAFLDAINEANS